MLMVLKSMENIDNAFHIIKEYGLEKLEISVEKFEIDMNQKRRNIDLQSKKWNHKRHFLFSDLAQFVGSFKNKDVFLKSIDKILFSNQLSSQLPVNSQTKKRNKI